MWGCHCGTLNFLSFCNAWHLELAFLLDVSDGQVKMSLSPACSSWLQSCVLLTDHTWLRLDEDGVSGVGSFPSHCQWRT